LALLLPLLLGLTFGAIEYGFYFFLQHNVQAAAREGARAGVAYGATEGDAEAKAEAFLTAAGLGGRFDPVAVTVGEDIDVTVQGEWGTVGLPLLFIPANKMLRGHAVMRKEALVDP
jgi:Flp pilus assembly protein TadG